VWTFGGTSLNGYLGSLITAALPHEKAVVSTSATVQIPNAPDEVADVIRTVLADRARRTELEAAALDIVPPVGIGKFWRYFGPRTRRNILARKLADGGLLLDLLPPQTVRISANEDQYDTFPTADDFE
jgi:hypothetical protein